MGPGYFILAILGCGEGDAACKQVAVADSVYSSQEACTADTEEAVGRYMDIAYPVVVAECRRAGAKGGQQIRADEVKLPPAASERMQRPIQRASYHPAKV
jgi:hypothetical protein